MKPSKQFVRQACGKTKRVRPVLCLVLILPLAGALRAQTPAAAGSSATKPTEGYTPGWTLGTKFEGSTSDDGTVLDFGSAVGYNFTRHFGVDGGIPYYIVGASSSIKSKNPDAVSGNGFGSLFTDAKLNYPGQILNYDATLHFTAPTGDTKKGFSTGHATWNDSNHFEHGWGNFTPYVDAGVGDTVNDTRYFHRPFITFGYNAQFEGGTEFDAGPVSLTAAAYDVAPWGSQTVISRVFRCSASTNCSASGKTTNRRGYELASVTSGNADLTRDNGFNFGAEFKPRPFVDLEVGYSRSVPLQLNSFSFGISLDVSGVLRPRAVR